MVEDWTESVADNIGDLLKPVKPGHPACPVPGTGDVSSEGVHPQVPDSAAPHQVIHVGQPQGLKAWVNILPGNPYLGIDGICRLSLQHISGQSIYDEL